MRNLGRPEMYPHTRTLKEYFRGAGQNRDKIKLGFARGLWRKAFQ